MNTFQASYIVHLKIFLKWYLVEIFGSEIPDDGGDAVEDECGRHHADVHVVEDGDEVGAGAVVEEGDGVGDGDQEVEEQEDDDRVYSDPGGDQVPPPLLLHVEVSQNCTDIYPIDGH